MEAGKKCSQLLCLAHTCFIAQVKSRAVGPLEKLLQDGICSLSFAEVGHTDLPDFLLWQRDGLFVPTWTTGWAVVGVERVSVGLHLRGGCNELPLPTALFTLSPQRVGAPSVALGRTHRIQIKACGFMQAKFKPKTPEMVSSHTLLFTCWKTQHSYGVVTRNFIVLFSKFINIK